MRLKLRLALRLGWRDRGVNLNAGVMEAVGKEHWDRSYDPREAMIGGLARSGRDGCRVPHVRPVRAVAAEGGGIILGIAVLRDALLVWLMLVPILLRLTGRAAWWLHRLVPDVRFGH